jgi:hypothetical protein
MPSHKIVKTRYFKDVCKDDEDWGEKNMAYAWEHRRKIRAQTDARTQLAGMPTKTTGVGETGQKSMGAGGWKFGELQG